MAVIASADWLASIKGALDAVESAGQAYVAANVAMDHMDDAAKALQDGDAFSASPWRSGAVVDIFNYKQRIAQYANPFVGEPGRSVSASVEWQALRNQIFAAYAYVQVVNGQFADGEDAGIWNANIVPMAEAFGAAIEDAPRVVVAAVTAAAGVASDAVTGVLGQFKWVLLGVAAVLVVGFVLYQKERHAVA